MEIIVAPDGTGRCVFGEELDLRALGDLEIRRASHVEPGAAGRWWADLSPAGGPLLGPFSRRGLALDAEAAWLLTHWLVPAPRARATKGEPNHESVHAAGGRRRGPGDGRVPGLVPRRQAGRTGRRDPCEEGGAG
jgi:hypothetical protein